MSHFITIIIISKLYVSFYNNNNNFKTICLIFFMSNKVRIKHVHKIDSPPHPPSQLLSHKKSHSKISHLFISPTVGSRLLFKVGDLRRGRGVVGSAGPPPSQGGGYPPVSLGPANGRIFLASILSRIVLTPIFWSSGIPRGVPLTPRGWVPAGHAPPPGVSNFFYGAITWGVIMHPRLTKQRFFLPPSLLFKS